MNNFKKHNRYLMFFSTLIVIATWGSYAYGVLHGAITTVSSFEAALSLSIVAVTMTVLGMVDTAKEIEENKQTPGVPKRDPTFATSIETAFYGIYQEMRVDKQQEFQKWVKTHMKNRWGEMAEISPPYDLTNWLFDQDNTYNVELDKETMLEGVYVLEFQARKLNGDKEYLQIIVTNEVDYEIYVRRGSSPATASSPWTTERLDSLSSNLETMSQQLSTINTRAHWL